ncbi:MAG: hypothetical protein HY840_11935 [Bacteroidetes bacterium]|nr:hypothetical protein [Bacteroidota bacterium]
MNVPSLQDVKQELQEISPKQLFGLCLSLAKYKKDNKEYLGYLLFQAHDRERFITEIKNEIDKHFSEIHSTLSIINKYCKYMGDKAVTAELLIYFCRKVKQTNNIPIYKSARLENLYNTQIKRIRSAITFLHEDIQADLLSELNQGNRA